MQQEEPQPKIPDPPPFTPDQCVELIKVGLWQNVLTNFLYLLPAALCFNQKRYIEGISLTATAIISTVHHNYDGLRDNNWFGRLDVWAAWISSLLLGRVLLESVKKQGWNAYSVSALSFSIVGFVILLSGESSAKTRNRGQKDVMYVATHSQWHILTALAGFILLLGSQ
jgi:hypothetical protein